MSSIITPPILSTSEESPKILPISSTQALYKSGTNLKRLHHYFQDLESPNHFIDWNFFFLVSSCLGRKIWIGNGFEVYSNIFVICVGKPGCGKSLPASRVTKILTELVETKNTESGGVVQIPMVKISPDSTTLEALWDALGEATDVVKICDNPKKFYAHASVAFCLGEEMGTLFRENTNDLVTFLTQAWDCRNFYRKTKTRGEVKINNMCVNMLGCCTPDWILRNMRTSLMHEGFTSRAVFLWGDKPRQRSTLLKVDVEQRKSLDELNKHLRLLAKLPPGEVKLDPINTPEAYEWFDNWVQKKQDKRINTSPKLEHYYGRKKVHLMKMAMIMHFMDKTTMELEVEDFEKALRVLEDAEIEMDKALSGQGENPLASIAESIVESIKDRGEMGEKTILLEFYDRADKDQLDKILQYLVYVGRIVSGTNNSGKLVYTVAGNDRNNNNGKIQYEYK